MQATWWLLLKRSFHSKWEWNDGWKDGMHCLCVGGSNNGSWLEGKQSFSFSQLSWQKELHKTRTFKKQCIVKKNGRLKYYLCSSQASRCSIFGDPASIFNEFRKSLQKLAQNNWQLLQFFNGFRTCCR